MKQATLLAFYKSTNKTLRDQHVALTIQLKTGKKPDPRVFFKGQSNGTLDGFILGKRQNEETEQLILQTGKSSPILKSQKTDDFNFTSEEKRKALKLGVNIN